MVNRIFIVIILVVVGVLAGWFLVQRQATSNWKTYQNPDYPFTFQYPQDWEEEDLVKANLASVVLVRVKPKGVDNTSLQMTRKTVDTRPSDEEVMTQVEKELKENFPTLQVVDKPTVETAGGKVPLLRYRYKTDKGEDVEQVMGVFWNNTTAYYVVGQSAQKDFKKYDDAFRRIMGSVSFKK